MRQLLDWQREAADPGDFLESLRFDLAAKEIFVFTPKGDVITLPMGSTPVDLAYAVHTEVGHRCIGSRVNGRLVALERRLESGDVVEIFTSKAETAGPSRDWLAFAASPRAKTKIKHWFAKERREEAIEVGKDAITREARRTGMPLQRLVSADAMAALARELHFPDLSGLYAAVGEGHVSARHVVQRLVALLGGVEDAEEELAERATPSTVRQRKSVGDAGVVVRGDDGMMDGLYTKLARCCTPVPGDDILGFVTRGGGVSVHRTDCTNAGDLQARSERLVDVGGRCRRGRCSSSRSRWRRSTGTGCSRTSPRCWPTRRSTSSRRRCRPRATGWRSPGSRSRWATPSTSGTCCGRCATSRASTTCTG